MKRWGLADGLGIVGALVALAYWPGATDPLTYPKLLVLAAGGLALVPAVVRRWTRQPRPPWAPLAVGAAALLLVVWGLISALGSGAPITVSLYGWWGRGDGWLALLGAAVLFLGAATLDRSEVDRTVTWLLGGGSIVGVIGLLQLAGVEVTGPGTGGAVVGTMGNTNFAAGYMAILAVLGLGRAAMPGHLLVRTWGAVLFALLGILTFLTDATQGPVALLGGVVAMGVVAALLNRGRWRVPGLAVAGSVVVIGVGLLVASFAGVGPLTRLWSESTFAIRQEYWQSAWNILNGVPVFGTGSDGFARHVSEYRPESYVELLGPILRVSAAHNIALQFGATLGWLGLVLWLVVFLGTAVALLVRVVRAPVASIGLTSGVAGAFAAYLVQGIVSIDMLPLLATGWLVAGLALAMSREATAAPSAESKPGAGAVNMVAVAAGAALGALGAVIVVPQIVAVNEVNSIQTGEQALNVVTGGLTPCPLRVSVSQQVLNQLPADVAVPALYAAVDLDPRCAPMINFQTEVALATGDLERAGTSSALGIEYDPLYSEAWILRGRYHLAVGDRAAAEADLAEAERLQALYPDPAVAEQGIIGLREALAQSPAAPE